MNDTNAWWILAALLSFSASCLTGFIWVPDKNTFSFYNIFWATFGGPIIWFFLGLLWAIHKWNDYEVKKHQRRYDEKH